MRIELTTSTLGKIEPQFQVRTCLDLWRHEKPLAPLLAPAKPKTQTLGLMVGRRLTLWNRLTMRDAIVELVREELGIEEDRDSLIHSDHNHVRQEVHHGKPIRVHRKGALSATVDEVGVIPGSMGTPSFHVAGRGNPGSLCSSSHGAGRLMSRTDAAKSIPT